MKAVLLAVNAKYIHSCLAVWVIAAGTEKNARFSHDVSVIESTIQQRDEDIADLVAAQEADVVGISTYIWNAAKLPGLLKTLRKRLPRALFVLGGPEAEHNAEYWLKQGADYVLPGEGEITFPAFLDHNTPKIPHSAFPIPHSPIDPYSESYLETLKGRLAYLETSRGCPFKCEFCLSAGSGVSFFPLDTVKEQIAKLSKSGAKTIKLVDSTFNCNAERAFELFEHIIGLDTDCRFHFEIAADLLDDRTIALLSSAPPGRIQFEAGLQSFFTPALEAVARKTDTETAVRNIKALLKGNNIHVHVDLIAGLPYERLDEFKNSFDRAYAPGAHTLQLGFLKLLHGSVLRDRADDLGIKYSKEPPYTLQSSPWLNPEDISVLKQTENALRHTYNKRRFLTALEYVISVSGMRPFTLYHALGEAVPNHGTQLETYAGQVFDFFANLPGTDTDELRDRMVCDWLGMVKGKNMPAALKRAIRNPERAVLEAEKRLGRKPGRGEITTLHSGKTVFADSASRDPVTGLYRIIIA